MPSESSVSSSVKKVTRNRPTTSCSECSRRKQKCNKQWPCSHCFSRKSPHLCRYSTGKSGTELEASARYLSKSPSTQLGNDAEDTLSIDPSSTVLESMLAEKNTAELSTSVNQDPRRTREELLKHFPPRHTVDILIQHFLAQVNWLYEEIDPPVFLESYRDWWCQPHYQNPQDVQFGIIILRLCVKALQFLPHPTGPAESEISNGQSFDDAEIACNEASSRLDTYQPRKPSLLRTQQLLLQIAPLINDGNAKESHHILGEAVKEAQGIGLFLEARWPDMSEFEKQERRKVFWSLYVWDRFHCTFLNRWPLIPEHYHSVKLPSEAPYAISNREGAPTHFTDVSLNYKLYQHMATYMSAPAKESERSNPYVIASYASSFKSHFVDILPTCFRMQSPDLTWDELIPSLAMKRQSMGVVVHGIVVNMHKCFVGPLTVQSLGPYAKSCKEDKDKATLVRRHRGTLANACIDALECTKSLHALMGGGSHRYFVLSIATIEATATLGMMIVSDLLLRTTSSPARVILQKLPLLDETLLENCKSNFQEGFHLLRLLAERSVLAQKGVRILNGLSKRMSELNEKNSSRDSPSGFGRTNESTARFQNSPAVNTSPTPREDMLDNMDPTGSQLGEQQNASTLPAPSFLDLEWESICTENDYSWYFGDWNSSEASGQFQSGGFSL